MKNLTVLALVIVLVGVLLYGGVNGIQRDHSYGPLFIFLGVCTAAGLSLDVKRLVKEKIRRSNAKKFGR